MYPPSTETTRASNARGTRHDVGWGPPPRAAAPPCWRCRSPRVRPPPIPAAAGTRRTSSPSPACRRAACPVWNTHQHIHVRTCPAHPLFHTASAARHPEPTYISPTQARTPPIPAPPIPDVLADFDDEAPVEIARAGRRVGRAPRPPRRRRDRNPAAGGRMHRYVLLHRGADVHVDLRGHARRPAFTFNMAVGGISRTARRAALSARRQLLV